MGSGQGARDRRQRALLQRVGDPTGHAAPDVLAGGHHTTLAEHAVTVNTVNPGPVDTGYLTGEDHDAVAALFPAGRWGMPDDPARLIAWLATDEADWVTGQVADSEGGFRR